MPPTIRDKIVINKPVPPIANFKALYCVSNAFVWLMAKSSFSPGFNPLILRITDCISLFASSICFSSTLTLRRIKPLLENNLVYAPIGSIA